MRVVAYIRVSSVGQVDAWGLDRQKAAVRKYATANGQRIVAWESDEGVSGTIEAVQRPGLSAAISRIGHGADAILIADLDRFARKLTVQETALALVWSAGGRVFTATAGEVLPEDPDDPSRNLIRQVMGAVIEYQKSDTVKKLRDGRRAKAAEGKHAVGIYPIGSQGTGKGKARDAGPNPAEQRAVDRIVALRRERKSYRQIIDVLQTEGYRPRSDKGANGDPVKAWSPMSVRSVAQRAGLA